jgi:hypothetical protein
VPIAFINIGGQNQITTFNPTTARSLARPVAISITGAPGKRSRSPARPAAFSITGTPGSDLDHRHAR